MTATEVEEEALEISDLLAEVVRALVRVPRSVIVKEVTQPARGDNREQLILSIHCDKEDRGRVIGKNGVTLNMLRELFRNIGTIAGKNVIVRVIG